eukprot:TRINITY_DN110708_c0_g1_i1.p1 TRINITY_DN110708_c0_g1~~TRINITY_DN110708_c0_g1_i1.p1  ORF type:complete len:462 (+),score=99.57 TRINITY_DN110708_c0_g1_i1:42-1388(+)
MSSQHHAASSDMGDDKSEDPEPRRTPLTVLTGALGAGKTTLLRYILEKPHGYRIAVIQNEFSEEMGMEAPLFTDSKGETIQDVYELPNGCLCCSGKDNMVGMLDVLLEQRDRFDYVLVEATGVADPEAICEVFWVDEGLGSRVYLDGVVTLVDSKNALSSLGKEAGSADGLGLEAEATKQVACADVLILNKTDLTSEAERKRVCAVLEAMNPVAKLLHSSFAAVPLADILSLKAFDRHRLAASVASLGGGHDSESHGYSHSHDQGSEGHASTQEMPEAASDDQTGRSEAESRRHRTKLCAGYSHGQGHDADCVDCKLLEAGKLVAKEHGVESVLLRGDDDNPLYDPDKVRSWLADVLWEESAGFVYRCKGLFRGPSEEEDDGVDTGTAKKIPVAHALQGVGKLFEIEEAPGVSVAQSKLLFIGRGLKRDALTAGLSNCKVVAGEGGGS